MDLKEFLASQKKVVPNHVVVGNQAGDADSIISALTLAYVDSVFGGNPKTPIVSITRKDLETQRPEVSFLFRTLGLDGVVGSLKFIDDPFVTTEENGNERLLTLVDHNRAEETFDPRSWKVVQIWDHHFDEQQHLETCSGESRHIAFEEDKSTAASTCTLIAERLQALKQPKYHSTIATLLLGTVLLDSVNMIPQAGKGTPRDASTIQDLLENTDWSTISKEATSVWWDHGRDPSISPPDTTKIFESLQAAKFDPNFWKGLSVKDALRLDYKSFSATSQSTSNVYNFGASAILMPMKVFLQNHKNVAQEIRQYMVETASVELLAILFFSTQSGEGQRQLILCGIPGSEIGKVVDDMAQSLESDATLKLKEEEGLCSADDNLTLRLFQQNNAKAGRKQVAPLLIQFFEKQ